MKIRFEQGDKARLVSGGPEMTIRGQHYDVVKNEYKTDIVDCIWFVKNNNGKEVVCYSPYNVDELVKTKNA
jgi:uncharacterized protein YodC (DUF2158 family)